MKRGLAVTAAVMLLFLSACVTRLPREGCSKYYSPQQAFLTGDYECAQKMNKPKMEEVLKKDPDHRDFAVWYLKEGIYYYNGGDYFDSQKDFKTARSVMERIREDSGRETGSMLWKEDVKTYKGDPYEKVLVNLMLGITYYRNEEYENALAAFRRSISADQLTHNDDDKFRDDNALAHFMAGKCYSQLKEEESARFHYRKAAALAPENLYFKPDAIPGKNLTVLIESGVGPMKIRSGLHGSLTTLVPPFSADYPQPQGVQAPPYAGINAEAKAEVYINNQLKASTAEALDVYLQAQSHGWGSKDTVQTVKAVSKEVISNLPFVGIAGALIQAQADIRVWNLVPAKYHVFTADLDPGLYNLTFKFYDNKGQELKYLEQTWYYLPVEEDKETFLVLRTNEFLHAWYGEGQKRGGKQ